MRELSLGDVMKPLAALPFVAALLCASSTAFGQSPVLVKYCQDLTSTYRKAVADGKPPQPGVGQASANCPTNPNDSISVLEESLKKMDVALPPK